MNKKLSAVIVKVNNNILFILAFILCCIVVIPMAVSASPMGFSDAVPMLHRVMKFSVGEIPLDTFLFTGHGNGLHSIVYATALVETFLFSGFPVLQKLLMIIAFVGAPMIIIILANKQMKNTYLKAVFFIICIFGISGYYADQLYLPFQIVLTMSRFLFMLILLGLITCFENKRYGKPYWLLIVAACIATTMHSTGLQFAASILFVHVIYKQKGFRLLYSLIPAAFILVLQNMYNTGMGEVSMVGGFGPVLQHMKIIIKSISMYFGMPINALFPNTPYRLIMVLGAVAFLIVASILLLYFLAGLGLTKRLETKYHVTITIDSKLQGLLLSLLGITFLASIGQAMFVIARLLLANASMHQAIFDTLYSTRYHAYPVFVYLTGLLWLINLFEKKLPSIKSTILKAAPFAIITALMISMVHSNYSYYTVLIKNRDNELDLSAIGILAKADMTHDAVDNFFPTWQNDWYWSDQYPILFNYFETRNKYLWYDMPKLGTEITDKDLSTIEVTNTRVEPGFLLIDAQTTYRGNKQYIPVVNSEKIVVGYAFIKQKKGFQMQAEKLYYLEKDKIVANINSNYSSGDNLYLVN